MIFSQECYSNGVDQLTEKIMLYTQDELSSVWARLASGTECDADGMLDVSDTIFASITTNIELEQAITFSTIAPYSDSNGDNTELSCSRERLSNEAEWGVWESKI